MLLPAVTGFGLPEFVTLRSAWPAPATAILTVDELSFKYVSRVGVFAVAVSVMIVPDVVPAFTLYMAVMVATEPGGTPGFVQATGPALGQVHVPPPVVTAESDTHVVFTGVASLNVAVLQLLGP